MIVKKIEEIEIIESLLSTASICFSGAKFSLYSFVCNTYI